MANYFSFNEKLRTMFPIRRFFVFGPRYLLNPLVCAFISLACTRGVCGNLSGCRRACTAVHARAWKRPVRACTRGCVGACNAREMRRTTIQILLLLLREQSPVNRPPRHNVSIQVRSAVLNRSGSTPLRVSKKHRGDRRKIVVSFAMRITEFSAQSPTLNLSLPMHEKSRYVYFLRASGDQTKTITSGDCAFLLIEHDIKYV